MMRPAVCLTIVAPNTWQVAQHAGQIGFDDARPVGLGHLERRHLFVTPRAATRISTPPRSRKHASRKRRHRATSLTSALIATIAGRARRSPPTAFTRSCRRPVATTSAPASASPSAMRRTNAARAADDDGDAPTQIERSLGHSLKHNP
jgi:hypothetical protein